MEGSRELIINELNWFALSQDVHFDEQAYENMLRDVQDNIGKEEYIVGLEKECNLLDNVGPGQSSIDLTLKDLGIERQVYHGSCFVGNQCHTLLKEKEHHCIMRVHSFCCF